MTASSKASHLLSSSNPCSSHMVLEGQKTFQFDSPTFSAPSENKVTISSNEKRTSTWLARWVKGSTFHSWEPYGRRKELNWLLHLSSELNSWAQIHIHIHAHKSKVEFRNSLTILNTLIKLTTGNFSPFIFILYVIWPRMTSHIYSSTHRLRL